MIKRKIKSMKTYRPKPIPPFKTLDEKAHFWDTHDLSLAFKNPKTPLSKLPLLEKEKDVVMTIRLQRSAKKAIEKIARSKGLNTTTLSRMWLIEKLQQQYSAT